ncbi:hypothetical protein DFH28DRAFT_1219910 [Melampsora americana]|nr:hypothetical protein DFH28DRAFT_1219910 [Melampsora americana]
MSVSSSISEDLVNKFSNFHLKDYQYPTLLKIYKNPPEHLKHADWVQTNSHYDAYVFRQVIKYLSEATIVHSDYDLYHVSLLLSTTDQSEDLKSTLQSTIAGLQPPNASPTSHQRVLEMAHLLGVIEDYEKKKKKTTYHLITKYLSALDTLP